MDRDEARSQELDNQDQGGKWSARWEKAQVQEKGKGARILRILRAGGMTQKWLVGSKCMIVVDYANPKVCL